MTKVRKSRVCFDHFSDAIIFFGKHIVTTHHTANYIMVTGLKRGLWYKYTSNMGDAGPCRPIILDQYFTFLGKCQYLLDPVQPVLQNKARE